jgi:hypothetical protein
MSLVTKKKVVLKKKYNTTEIVNILNDELTTTYDIEVQPDGWVLPNRTKFSNWIDKEFKYPKKSSKNMQKLLDECQDGEDCPKVNIDHINLFPHQHFIKDYIQFNSPYRGVLLFHGLGVGKTASSIAAAEILINRMEVIVMLPASLRNNYINEIKKYGKKFYRLKQHWVFIENNKDINFDKINKILSIDSEFTNKQNGLWIPINAKGAPNFNTLSKEKQNEINLQINFIIEKKFNFINYNGLKREHIKKMIANGNNPFDNKCIIIDEIHNLISRIVGGRMIGTSLYKLLMSAKNAKLILLSGTPIINYPYEISYLINLITGPRTYFELTFIKNSEINNDLLNQLLNENKNIDFFNFDRNTRKLTITLLPFGFQFKNKELLVERIKGDIITDDIILENIITTLTNNKFNVSKKISTKDALTLPQKQEEFNNYFISTEHDKIINENMFMKRILGTVSYYSTYSEDLYPSVEIVDVPVPLNDYQFSVYEKSRIEERKKESKMKLKMKNKQSSSNDPFSDSGQVYRFYSRANCNFVFPEKIKRPFPSSIKALKKLDEIDDLDDTVSINTDEDDTKVPDDYITLIKKALLEVYNGNYLTLKEIAEYSPKFKLIINKIHKSVGKSLVYSQFRTVEGLGLLGLAFKKLGYAEIKLKKVHGEYELDIKEEDIKKPKFMMFTGSNPETQILLNIFNSNFENIPDSIKTKLDKLDNTHGDIIKMIFITQSGAEGISLKHVRQVHILESYWNHIRIDQVIGRAVRANSHVELPAKERNVLVYIYYSTFTEKQISNSFTIKTLDKSITSDEYIYNIAKRKKKITDGILELLKKASVDCAINGYSHKGLKCYSFPVNMNDNQISYDYNIAHELDDQQYSKIIEQTEFDAEVFITKKGNFLINKLNNFVYDYDVYVNSHKLVKIGVLKIVDNKKLIMNQ